MFAVALSHDRRLTLLAQKADAEAARQKRLDTNVRHLYHQTSKENADAILKEQRMLPGTSGLAGGGIYFAETAEHTDHKAFNRGVVLEADVRLGCTKTVAPWGEENVTYDSLLQQGYDSVLIPRQNGYELVVYNPDQVVNIRVHAVRKQHIHRHTYNRAGNFAGYQPTGYMNF